MKLKHAVTVQKFLICHAVWIFSSFTFQALGVVLFQFLCNVAWIICLFHFVCEMNLFVEHFGYNHRSGYSENRYFCAYEK